MDFGSEIWLILNNSAKIQFRPKLKSLLWVVSSELQDAGVSKDNYSDAFRIFCEFFNERMSY